MFVEIHFTLKYLKALFKESKQRISLSQHIQQQRSKNILCFQTSARLTKLEDICLLDGELAQIISEQFSQLPFLYLEVFLQKSVIPWTKTDSSLWCCVYYFILNHWPYINTNIGVRARNILTVHMPVCFLIPSALVIDTTSPP